MLSKFYYNRLKELILKKELEIILLISPPRANSSVLEVSLGSSDDIGICHEPFNHARKEDFNPDDGYKNIYDSITNKDTGEKYSKVIIKEMAQWIMINSEYKDLFLLTNLPVIFLIRNPLLCIESRVKKVLASLSLRPGLSLQQFLFQKLSNVEDFNYHDYLFNITKVKNIELRMLAAELDYDISKIKILPNLDIQNFLLDAYAQRAGFINWENLLNIRLTQEGYFEFFTEILKVNSKRVSFEKDEFYGLFEIYNHCIKNHLSCYVYDTTDIRILPENYIKDICNKLHFIYNQKMIDWGQEDMKNFNTGQNKKHETIWYDKLRVSSKINLPHETPSNICKFPVFMQEYLVKLNYPIYIEMTKHKVRMKDVALKITQYIETIDPIYLAVNNPKLCYSEEFVNNNLKYKNEILMVKKINEENPEIKKMENLLQPVEYIDIVDAENNIIGTSTAKEAHEQKLLHRVVGVLLFDIHGNLFFQSGTKYNLLDLSVGGHVIKGESYIDAAKREMYEELNLETDLQHISVFYPQEQARFGHFWSIYEAIIPEGWEFKPTFEVPDLVKMKYTDVLLKINESPELFTKGFLNVFGEYLKCKNK